MRSGRTAEAHFDGLVGGDGGGDIGIAAQPFEQRIALVEQRGLVAAGVRGAGEVEIDPGDFAGQLVDLIDAVRRLETQPGSGGIEAGGGDIEGAGHRARILDHRGAQGGIDRIGGELLQRRLEGDDCRKDAGLLDRALDIFQPGHFGFGARGIGAGAAHFGLAEDIGVADHAAEPDARQRNVADPLEAAR